MYENRVGGINAMTGDDFAFPIHSHYNIEITVCTEGRIGATCNGRSEFLEVGDMMIAFPNDSHGYFKTDGGRRIMIFASPLLLPPVCKELLSLRYENFLLGKGDNSLFLARELLKYCNTQNSELEKTAYICLILAFALKHLEKKDSLPLDEHDDFGRILRYVSEHYKEHITLKSVARRFGTDYYNLSKAFASRLSVTFTHYIHILRTEEAKLLLRTTNKVMTEICYECGFSDIRTFNRVFKSIAGVPPRTYKTQS